MLPIRHPADDWAALDSARYYAAARLGTRGWNVGGTLRRVGFALINPHLVPNYVRLLRRLPIVVLALSAFPAGRLLNARWARQSWRKSASHADLALPSTFQAYLRGRSRQAVRTNLHRAQAMQLTCRRVSTDWDSLRSTVDSRSLARLVDALDPGGADTAVQSWAVFAPDGTELGRAVAVADTLVAVLVLLVGPRDLSVAHQTRYLLHTRMVQDLIDQGVRHVVVESILGAPPGHKYFAARLGYRGCRLRVTRTAASVPIGAT